MRDLKVFLSYRKLEVAWFFVLGNTRSYVIVAKSWWKWGPKMGSGVSINDFAGAFGASINLFTGAIHNYWAFLGHIWSIIGQFMNILVAFDQFWSLFEHFSLVIGLILNILVAFWPFLISNWSNCEHFGRFLNIFT